MRSVVFIHVSRSSGEVTSLLYIQTAALNAKYVDYIVRGQGEDTFLELLDAIRGKRTFESILGLSYKDIFGLPRNNAERPDEGAG